MTCSFSAPLSEEQIMAALDNDVPSEIADHLRNCEECRARFEVEQRLEGELMHGLFRVDCPSLDKLRDYAFNLLTEDVQKMIDKHLKHCAHCQQDIASMKTFSDRASNQVESERSSKLAPMHKWPLVPPNALFGRTSSIDVIKGLRVRGSINGILLEASDVSIALEVEQNDDHGLTLVGQMIVPDLQVWNEALVELWRDGQIIRFAMVDDTGVFECNTDSVANIRLVITNQNEQVVIFNDINFPTQ